VFSQVSDGLRVFAYWSWLHLVGAWSVIAEVTVVMGAEDKSVVAAPGPEPC